MAVFQPRPGLGDLIWHLPLIRAVAAASKEGRVTLVTKPSTQAETLLRGDPAIERIVAFERNPRGGAGRHDGVLGFPRLVADLRACRVDTCVLLHHGASLAAAMRLAGIPARYGYGYSAAQRAWLNRPPFLPPPPPFTEAAEQAGRWAERAGLAGLPEPRVSVDAAARPLALARLADVPRPWAVLAMGAHGAERQWNAPSFSRLASLLAGRGMSVLLLAAGDEARIARAIQDAAPRSISVVGWPLDQVVALLAEAELFVGNDSGPANLRAAVGRPAYVLFGASGPLRHSRLIRPVIPPDGPRSGMAGITVDQVMAALPTWVGDAGQARP